MRIEPEDFAEVLEAQLDAVISTARQFLQEKGVFTLMFEGQARSLEYVLAEWKLIQMKLALEMLLDLATWKDTPSLSVRLQ